VEAVINFKLYKLRIYYCFIYVGFKNLIILADFSHVNFLSFLGDYEVFNMIFYKIIKIYC